MASCTNCGKDASVRCSGCMGAPEYQPGDSVDIFYCGHECQRAHWPSHKPYCSNMKRRKSLFRAAKLLKATLLSYREIVYDYHVTNIRLRPGKLVLTHNPLRHERHRFPSHLTKNVEHKEAALLFSQCTLSMSLLGPMTRRLLTGNVSNMEVVSLRIGNVPFPARLNPPDNNGTDTHTIIRATLHSSDEKWVIDITSCQYGFRDIVVPFEKYITQNHCTVNEPLTPYIHTETTDQDLVHLTPQFLTRGLNPTQQNDVNTEIGYRRHFATLVPAHVDNSLLQGSDSEFTTKMNDFTQRVRMHMSSYQPA